MQLLPSGTPAFALAFALAIGHTTAQEASTNPPSQQPKDAPTTSQDRVSPEDWKQLFTYDELLARAAFVSCDLNADDKIDILEADRTIYGVDKRDTETFNPLDLDADGHLQFPEFQARYMRLSELGSPFIFLPLRPFTPRERDQVGSASPQQHANQELMAVLDQNGDGTLEPAEVQAVLEAAGLPESLMSLFKNLDQDKSGQIDDKELAPVARLLPGPKPGASVPGRTRQLPDGFASGDANGDDALDSTELSSVLTRLDPTLARWANELLNRADTSKNELLEPAEIDPSKATATKPRRLPQPRSEHTNG